MKSAQSILLVLCLVFIVLIGANTQNCKAQTHKIQIKRVPWAGNWSIGTVGPHDGVLMPETTKILNHNIKNISIDPLRTLGKDFELIKPKNESDLLLVIDEYGVIHWRHASTLGGGGGQDYDWKWSESNGIRILYPYYHLSDKVAIGGTSVDEEYIFQVHGNANVTCNLSVNNLNAQNSVTSAHMYASDITADNAYIGMLYDKDDDHYFLNPAENSKLKSLEVEGTLTLSRTSQDNSLNKILVIDDDGNVYWRDASTLIYKDYDWLWNDNILYANTSATGVAVGGTTVASGYKLDVYGNLKVRGNILALGGGTISWDPNYNEFDFSHRIDMHDNNIERVNKIYARKIIDRDNSAYYLDPSYITKLYELKLAHVVRKDSLNKVLVLDSDGTVKWRDASTFAGQDYDWLWNGKKLYANLSATAVGIGTKYPSYKLHVVGDIYSTATVIADNVRTDDLYSPSSAIYIHAHFNPKPDGTKDLGWYKYRWRNLYIKEYSGGSGFIQMGTSSNYGRLYYLTSSKVFRFTKGIDVSGSVKSYSIYPKSSNRYDLGSSSLRWKTLYVNRIYAYGLPSGSTSDYLVTVTSSGQFRKISPSSLADKDWIISGNNMYAGVSGKVGIGTNYPTEKLDVVGNIKAYRFIDRNNAYYYVDPASTSNLKEIKLNGGTLLQRGSNKALKIYTGYGYIEIGPKNYGWAHIVTDRPMFYFNKEIRVDTGRIGSYNENLYLLTSGTIRMTILNSNGYVGIGTVSPKDKLEVAGNVRASKFMDRDDARYYVDPSSITRLYKLKLVRVDRNNALNKILVLDSDGTIKYREASTLKDKDWVISGRNMYAGVSGHVGIGTSSPAYKLHVVGSVAAYRLVDINNRAYYVDPASTSNVRAIQFDNSYTKLEKGSSNALRIITHAGYVEIGPKNSAYAHIVTDRSRFYFNKPIVIDSGIISTYDDNLYLRTAGITRITVLRSNGNVGIGVSSPTEKLDVAGNVKAYKFIDKNNARYFLDPSSSSVSLTTAGKVGIGTTSPTAKLDVRGNVKAYSIYPLSSGRYDLGSSSLRWKALYTNKIYAYELPTGSISDYVVTVSRAGELRKISPDSLTDKDWTIVGRNMYTSVSGNVGIGTKYPSYKLHVVGDIYSTATVIADNVRTDDLYSPSSAIYIHAHFNPKPDGTKDLGWYKYRWRNLYIKEYSGGSGFIQMGTSSNYGRLYYLTSSKVFRFTKGIDVSGTVSASSIKIYKMSTGTGLPVVYDTGTKTLKVSRILPPIPSSIEYKENIKPISGALDKILALKPVEFTWKDTKKKDIGLIAEDVAKVAPELVVYENGKPEAIKYGELIVMLVKAIQEQQEQINQIANAINSTS